jgi:Rps23 Pro-64 3,4-dihydroxylase Tpa1-like proline 4-hydroxylase
LYLGGVTDEPWDMEEHGGQLRIFLGQVDRIPLGARDDSKEENVTTEHYMDIIPDLGTLVLFDSATVPHEVLPTKRDRLAVVGWFGTIV